MKLLLIIKSFKNLSLIIIFLSLCSFLFSKETIPARLYISNSNAKSGESIAYYFELDESFTITLEIYNSAGYRIALLIDNESKDVGTSLIYTLNTSNMSTGYYFFQLSYDKKNIKKAFLIR